MSINRAGRWRNAIISPTGIAATFGLLVVAWAVIFGPVIWGISAMATDLLALSQPPSPGHLFGTDAGGRDVFARTMTASRLSVAMALAASCFGVVAGVSLGLLPSVLRPALGRAVVASFNFAIAFPSLLLTIFLSVIFGQSSWGAVLAIGMAIVPAYARLTHTLSSAILGRDFIAAARVLGVGKLKVVFRHVLPNIYGPLIVNASVTASGALIAFASLSFLGLGVQPPEFDWGRMLNEGLSRIFVNPATALAPGAAVVFAGVVFTLAGELIARGLGVNPGPVARLPKWTAGTAARGRGVAGISPSSADVFTVENLNVAVPTITGWFEPVKGVSFSVGRGELVGIVGESGSGKSLTCMAATGLLDFPLKVNAERVTFDGVELLSGEHRPRTTSARRVQQLLGTGLAMVFQDPMSSLNPSLKVGTQVAEVGYLHGGLTRKMAWAKAIDRLKDVKIGLAEKRVRQHPYELSGGMRQRVMMAMGLMGVPSLIIADEPTTALDVTVQREVLGLLHELHLETGTAILMISHDMAVVTGLCTRVLVMYQGEVVENIATEDLLAGKSRHPYTRALMAVVPDMDTDRTLPMPTIPEGLDFSAEILRADA
ncbi:dipeptide/oligopeptide/nickel ABC transporter permease/ATP-binding protein [Arthrobacter sp. 4R501]|uniref:dipeptide/oligopeptide/nickel ABC transporter permease/ATP-binding protein n=1 Tax=Arthrobacter sp. 4R501 TaxID=2058886 RepID=UPI000CE423AA|nr:dipeptide/oligopeptide/nickel ABC transporter permease/ATP-binding protein [Arthrobacter sp. 4R501]